MKSLWRILHPKSSILWQLVTTFIETRPNFMKNVLTKKKLSLHLFSMLWQVRKSYSSKCLPGMSKQPCNQHWIRELGVGVLQILSLIPSKIKIRFWEGFFKNIFFWKSGLYIKRGYIVMFICLILGFAVHLSLKILQVKNIKT